ncbi:mitofilin family membrane protein [Ciceribacter azotifigens]|uniref:mitofilin family membrane protein n=1 Tax=Ciceribacter azotifigens TaxID=2069303 RepID=UPI003A876248
MVSGKPPRRSKSSNEPVTIDLQAEETSADAAASASETESPKERATDAEMLASDGTETAAHTETEAAPATDTIEADDAKSGSLPLETPRQPKGTPTMAAVAAAGIVGGLVALAAAGSMQYAGYLPALSPTSERSTADQTAELAALRSEVEGLRSAVSQGADTKQIEERLAALESAASQPVPAADTTGLDQVREQLTGLQSTLETLRTSGEAATTRLSELETSLDGRIAEIEKKLEEPRDDVEVARAIAVAGLKAAVDRGGTFLTELDTLAGITPDDPIVGSLRDYARTGIPSRADLVRQFQDTASSILSAVNQPDPNQGLAERLLSSALSVVKVRPVGNVEGDTPEAIVARMEDKLRNGDLQGASLEWDTLPEAGKAASADFAKALKSRIEVEKLVGTAMTSAVGGNRG